MVSGTDQELANKIQKFMNDRLGNGTAVSFSFIKDGEVLCSLAAGDLSTTKDLYNIGSVSKTFCAAAVLKLCEMGLADLDTPVIEYLPDFVMKDERYRKITLRMCLNHSSGLPGTMLKDAYSDKAGMYNDFRDTFFSYLAGSSLKAEPGTRSSYCNDGFDVASEVVAEISGMTYTSVLKKYIADPLEIGPLCTPEDFDRSVRHVICKGYGEEFLNSLGSGGIALSVEDCAKFGWEFVRPGQILSAGSVAESAVPQRLSNDPEDSALVYGLGWDDVDFSCPEIDLGHGVLMKSGGTPSFITYLLVSPELSISAAISATRDVGWYVLPFFIELITLALSADKGILSFETKEAKPVPSDLSSKYSGTYFSCLNTYQISFGDNDLTIEKMSENGWAEITKASFDGEYFNGEYEGDEAKFSFKTINGIDYLNVTVLYKGLSQIAEKPEKIPPAIPAWTARKGKKYLIENGRKWDIAAGSTVAGISLKTSGDSGLILAMLPGLGGSLNVVPTAAKDDNAAGMFLTATNGGNNQFEITAYFEGGTEHLNCAGYSFIETGAIPVLGEDSLIIGEGDKCSLYRIESPAKLAINDENVRIILLDNDLHITCDSRLFGFPETAHEGYIVILRDSQ